MADPYGIHKNVLTVKKTRLGDPKNGNYFENKNDGEVALHGTARVKKNITLAGRVGAAPPAITALGDFYVYAYTIGDDYHYEFKLPKDWDSITDLVLHLDWAINEAYATASGEVQWQIDYSAVPVGEAADAPTHNGQLKSGDINIPATAKHRANTQITIPVEHLTAGNIVALKLSRVALDGGTNPTAEPLLLNAEVEYTINKLGEAL